MKHRHVFSTADETMAQAAIIAAREAGIHDEDIALIARSDIELRTIPDKRLDASTDALPAALRGAGAGGAVGLLAGIVAVAVPAVGITIAGVGLLTAIGAAVGSWTAALAGSTVPNTVRRAFEDEIAQGRVLVVIDADPSSYARVHDRIAATGATALPFDQYSATA